MKLNRRSAIVSAIVGLFGGLLPKTLWGKLKETESLHGGIRYGEPKIMCQHKPTQFITCQPVKGSKFRFKTYVAGLASGCCSGSVEIAVPLVKCKATGVWRVVYQDIGSLNGWVGMSWNEHEVQNLLGKLSFPMDQSGPTKAVEYLTGRGVRWDVYARRMNLDANYLVHVGMPV